MKKMMWTLALVISVALVGSVAAGVGCSGCKTKTQQTSTAVTTTPGCTSHAEAATPAPCSGTCSGHQDQAKKGEHTCSGTCAQHANGQPCNPATCSAHANGQPCSGNCATTCAVKAAGQPCPGNCQTMHVGQACTPESCTYCSTFKTVLEGGAMPEHECVDHANCQICAAATAALQVRNAPKPAETPTPCAPGCTGTCGPKKAGEAPAKS